MGALRTDAGRRPWRFLSRGIPAAVTVWGALWAVSAVAFQQPAKIEPKAEVKDDEPRYEFAISGKPWKDVFVWLNEKTGLPVVGVAVPTGTLNLIVKADKKYTIAEVIDLINEGLLSNEPKQQYYLIRRERNFVLVPADQKFDPVLAPLVNLVDLKKHAKSQLVTIVRPLRALVADEVKDEVAKMLSPFGNVVAMKPNSLRIVDNVGNLEFILEVIKQSEDSEQGNSETYSHICKYVQAREAERMLHELLPDPERMLKLSGSAPTPSGDPRIQPRQPAVALPKLKIFSISADEVKNTIFVTGPADILAKAKDLVEKKIDVGTLPILVGEPKFRTIQIGGGNAEALAKTLNEIYKPSATLRITAVGNNALQIYATPEDHGAILRRLGVTDEHGIKTKLVNVGGLDPKDVAATLVKWLGEPKTGAPNIDAQPDTNSVAVRGNQAQIEEVEAIVKTLGAIGGTGGVDNMRVITLEKGSGVSVAEEIGRLFPQLRANPVQIIRPGAEPEPKTPSRPMQRVPDQSRLPGDEAHLVNYQPPEVFTDPKNPANGKPLIITAAGNKIILYSEDPTALAAAHAMIKLITKSTTTEGDFEVIKLKNAPAADAARVLDEAFNGKQQQQQNGRNRGFNPGGFSAPDAQAQPQGGAREDRIRVVADANTNSILVRAIPVDLLTIRRMLQHIDSPEVNSAALQKSWTIGPLKNTSSAEVVVWLKEVYHQQTNANAQSTQVSGLRGFAFGGFGGQQNTSTPQTPVALSIAHDERTNSLLLLCNERMYKDIEALVSKMDEAAKDNKRAFKVVSIQGVDPVMLQQALSIFTTKQLPTTGGNTSTPGSNQPGGPNRGGNGYFQPGGSQQGGSQRDGSQQGGSQPGGPRRGGTSRGGMSSSLQGPDFFADRVKDDPELTDIFFDPHQVTSVEPSVNASIPVGEAADRAFAALQQVNHEESQVQPPMPMPPAGDVVLTGPRSLVNATTLDELGLLLLSGNAQDIAEIIKIVEQLQKYYKEAAVAVELVPMKYADATVVTNILSRIYQRVNVTATGNSPVLLKPTITSVQGNIGANSISLTQTVQQPASVGLLALPRFNAILVAAPTAQLKFVKEEIKKLDVPNSTVAAMTPFKLKTASASRVAALVTSIFNQRYGVDENANQHQIRIYAEDHTNTVFVQAAPTDMDEIKTLIEFIDGNISDVKHDFRIVPLKNALADDLAALLQKAITDGIVTPSQPTPGIPGATGGLGAAAAPGALGAAQPLGAAARPGATVGTATRSITLRFVSKFGAAQSGLLEDIHLTADTRTNSILISAPEKTMELLLRLIDELDVQPLAKSFIKVYTLRKANAATTANLLQQLFLGTTGAGAARPAGIPGVPGIPAAPAAAPGALGGTGAAARPILLTIGGDTAQGAPIIDVRVTTDDRTNSIIYAGSENDVRVIEALLVKLDDTEVQSRRFEVYHLRNSTATDVANALNTMFASALAVEGRGGILSPFEDLLREVVVVPEPITNKLLISAAPRAFPDVYRLVLELDMEPPQVVIQVMIAEVDLTGSEEFGVEIGMQSPVLFQRGIIPDPSSIGTGTVSFVNAVGGLVAPGVTVTNVNTPSAQPGFAFTNLTTPLGNNPNVSPGVVGFQGVSSLGVGRTSALTGGPGGLVFSAGSDAFNILVRALKTQGRMDILNSTKVMTVDNQSAGILVGQSFPYVTGSTTSSLGTVTNSVAYRNVGVQLQVTPHINPDGKVIMRVLPEVSSVDTNTGVNISVGTTAVAFNVQNVETTVIAQDGETVALGGLVSKSDIKGETKVPWLGDLPGVGALFRFRTQLKKKQELIIILTPHVVRNHLDVQRMLCDDARQMNWCLSDVERLYGPLGLENCPAAGGGKDVDGSLPLHPMVPGTGPVQISPLPEVAPPPRPILPSPTYYNTPMPVVPPPIPSVLPRPQAQQPVPELLPVSAPPEQSPPVSAQPAALLSVPPMPQAEQPAAGVGDVPGKESRP